LLSSILDDIEPRNQDATEVADYYGRWQDHNHTSQVYWLYNVQGKNVEIYQPEWRGVS
jgi:hypothetical protein